MLNLMFMLRELNVLTNSARAVTRYYRDQKERARFGIVWPEGDDDAEKVIYRFFRQEAVFRRILLLKAHKNKSSGKYKHLTLFGFYLQLDARTRLLAMIDWSIVRMPKSIKDEKKE
jgi:hypothetical protein